MTDGLINLKSLITITHYYYSNCKSGKIWRDRKGHCWYLFNMFCRNQLRIWFLAYYGPNSILVTVNCRINTLYFIPRDAHEGTRSWVKEKWIIAER